MTDRKHLKSRVRARMERTGERYASARAHVVGGPNGRTSPSQATRPPGTNPATAALVAVLEAAGLPVTEPLGLVIGGGIGIGVFQFHYAREGVSTCFVAGRHRWDDDAAYLTAALGRLGLEPRTTETTSARLAERHLRDGLAEGGPVVAWVDAAELGTRGYPDRYRGGAYHVVVVRSLDDANGTAILEDLAAVPVEVPLDTLARARGRIAKDRNRLLWLSPSAQRMDDAAVHAAIRSGVAATLEGLDHPRSRSFSLAALDDWSRRLRGAGKDAWPTVFPAGVRMLDGLAAIHEYIEHHGSGGGLLRPIFASGLRAAASRLGDTGLAEAADRYADLGDQWRALATAALPAGVPPFRKIRDAQDRRAAAYRAGGSGDPAVLAAAWAEADAARAEVADCWPLEAAATAALLDELAAHVAGIRDAERAALAALRSVHAG